MLKKNEQLAAETQKAIDTAMELVSSSIHSVEKLTHIQLETSRQILEETSQAVKELANVTDAKEIFARVNKIATHAVEKNIASAKNVYEIVSEVQAKISKATEDRVQSLQQAALTSLEGVSQINPAASDALKTWINSANQALSTMNKVATQVTELANSNFAAATTKAATATTTTKKPAAK